MGEFTSLRTLINENFKKISDQIKVNQPTVTRDDGIQMSPDVDVQDKPKGQPKSDTTNTDVNPVSDEAIVEGNNTSEMLCIILPICVSKEVHVSQFELPDQFLPSQKPEARIMIHHAAKNPADATPLASHRNRRASRWYSSPYESNFDSAGTSVKLTHILDKKHLFEDDLISGPHPTLVIQEYEKWVRDGLIAKHYQKSDLEDHYKKNKSTLHIPLDFGVDQVTSKNWFYLLSFDGKLWNDNTRIAEIFDADTNSNANVAEEEDVVCEYIRGYRLLANVPWHTVDNVLIPVNLKDKLHWVLAVVSFKDRCIKVYDSIRSSLHDAYVASEIDKLAKLVPLYLSISGFYRDKQGIDWTHDSAYSDKAPTDPFDVVFISNLSQQNSGSIYGALLWDYAMRKIDVDAISESEAPSKILRHITDSDTSVKIMLE
ncbi:PREDICTED: uncharacterized protein LOC109209756 [Nicotiana attenuata]|uniref:uncharacterized protein LOC109209756 n=1 Tax=Nicotiana attenuata TaxID=49451 RepID=UPI00090515D8|nr:PREDICTED: uncharacterized protein LOC109209756 [Nicotiana attenuata]